MKQAFKAALLRTLPVMAGYVVLGFGFGIIAEKSGFGVLWALGMSVFVYAGSMQYVAIGLASSGTSLAAVALATLAVNARHLFYGVSMIGPYRGMGAWKPYLIFALTDETYSLVCTGEGPEGVDFRSYCRWVSLLDHSYWILGTMLGALAGTLITFNTQGVDFAMTALFLTVFTEQWLSTKNHLPALTGVLVSLLCLLLLGPDRFLIPAMLGITLVLLLGQKWMGREKLL